ncbi:hypothetical protein IFO69_08735 [Echinicola sp. CAU 1574]|uniref:Class I SAM-dependent methyltransferase n=1 Tax=Echinicola arenosa TaxID=2774144 RepID=A0ABR9AJ88_9BACT|nr:hypothetical protein [Echinicola arenosa]MBD8488827.1 hypothetical protein [Echinicola arenosa]
MKRIHLFEFEDLPWFPVFLRNYVTDFLRFLANATKMFLPILPVLVKGIHAGKTGHFIDLGSGSGGGILSLNEALLKKIPHLKIWLTDYYPNIEAFEYTQAKADNIEYVDKPVDARNVPEELNGLRTMFLSFHHFKHEDAQLILQDAVDAAHPIAIFEAQDRSLPSLLAMLFSPITVLLTTPFIAPLSLGRLFFTYIVPVVPLVALWDGLVSSLRTYSLEEMQELIDDLKGGDRMNWEMAKIKSGPGFVIYLLGTPK